MGRKLTEVKPVYLDPEALAKAIREARGAMSQAELGRPIGLSAKTVMRWEKADVKSLGETPEKRFATAVLVAEVTGRRDLLGLEPATDELAEIRRAIAALATLATATDLDPEARQLLEAELAVARQWSTKSQSSEEPGSEAGSR